MRKLDKKQAARHAEISAKLSSACEELNGGIETFNGKVAALFAELVQPRVDAINTAVEEANTFVSEIHDEMQEHFDEKSERWQEGDAGLAYADWMATWEMEVDTLELDEPAEYDEPDADDVDAFESLPLEADS